MRKMHWLFIFALLSTMNVQARESELVKYKIKWVLAHEPIAVFEMAAKFFAEKVYRESDGRLVVEIVGKEELPNKRIPLPATSFQMLTRGDYQMSQTYTSFLGQYVKDMWALEAPFLFRDHAHATRVLDGKIGHKILQQLEPHKVRGLAFTYSGGYRILPTGKTELVSASSFKGISVRVSDNPLTSSFFRKIGAKPIVAFDQGALEKGLDSFESTYARLDNIKPLNASYILESNHSILLTALIINQDFYNSLPQKYQKIIEKVAKETAIYERDFAVTDGERSKNNYIKSGIKIGQMKAEEVEKLKSVANLVHAENEYLFSSNLIREIKSQ